ncbi:MAG: ATP-binding cassette domain-containing protein, partial [Deltaproteobacteria bacterium]|nr:ATP-binding cassette domain-containing protein [Deltaproteobacteria bacterium]
MILTRDLHFAYEDSEAPVLKGINMEIREGDHVAIIGPNGDGKTTLVKQLNGLLLPTKGEVQVDGMDTRDGSNLKRIRQRVGMVFQNPDDQIVGMTVEEDVAFGPGNMQMPPAEIRGRVRRSLEMVGMDGNARRAPQALSNGEKQLVAIAGVLAMEPRYIIFDEPTTYLDPLWKKKIMEVILGLKEKGIGIVHVTHNMDEAGEADLVFVMNRGEIVTRGGACEIFSKREYLDEIG